MHTKMTDASTPVGGSKSFSKLMFRNPWRAEDIAYEYSDGQRSIHSFIQEFVKRPLKSSTM